MAQPPGLIAHFPFDAPRPVIEPPKVDPKKPHAGRRRSRPSRSWCSPTWWTPRSAAASATSIARRRRCPARSARRSSWSATASSRPARRSAFFERNEPFSVGLWVRVDAPAPPARCSPARARVMNGHRGYEVMLRADGTLTAGLHHVAPDNSIEIETSDAGREAGHVAAPHADLRRLEPRRRHRAVRRRRPAADRASSSITCAAASSTTAARRTGTAAARRSASAAAATSASTRVTVDELRVFDRQLSRFEVAGARRRRRSARRRAADRRPRRDRRSSRPRCANTTCCASIRRPRRTRRTLTGVRGEENALLTSLVEVMAMRERAEPRQTFILARGAYDAPTEPVEPGTPAALGAFPKGLPANRLGPGALARVARASADGAGDRQPHLGAAVRARPGRDAGRLRQPGPAADAPGAARLAGDALRRARAGI